MYKCKITIVDRILLVYFDLIGSLGITTGFSDHYQIINTSFNAASLKCKPIERTYLKMKNFDGDLFRNKLSSELNKIGTEYESFEDIILSVLKKHALIRKIYQEAIRNFMLQKPFVNQS